MQLFVSLHVISALIAIPHVLLVEGLRLAELVEAVVDIQGCLSLHFLVLGDLVLVLLFVCNLGSGFYFG